MTKLHKFWKPELVCYCVNKHLDNKSSALMSKYVLLFSFTVPVTVAQELNANGIRFSSIKAGSIQPDLGLGKVFWYVQVTAFCYDLKGSHFRFLSVCIVSVLGPHESWLLSQWVNGSCGDDLFLLLTVQVGNIPTPTSFVQSRLN